MICRNCANAYIPTSDNKREAEGIEIMVRNGYRQCKEDKTPEGQARWLVGGWKCINPEAFKERVKS